MKSEPTKSGFEELTRLSQQFTKQKQEHTKRERQREEQAKKVHGVLQGLKELKVSMAIEQLKPVAKPEIIRRVNALRGKQETGDLRKAISDLADELENRIGTISASNPDTAPLLHSMETLNILLNLYFSL